MKQFGWTEISSCPESPGVYAWYYNPEITEFDLKETISKIDSLKNEDKNAAESIIKTFLNNFIFSQFTEDPYQVTVKGPLKPKYEGEINNIPTMSQSLIERILEIPSRLNTIKEVIEKSAPYFSSPIYIGMAENLKKRLSKHKRLIERFRDDDSRQFKFGQTQAVENINGRDQSFAWQVCKRNISPTKLFVMVRVVDETDNNYLDIENILNRIHYPLFGRN